MKLMSSDCLARTAPRRFGQRNLRSATITLLGGIACSVIGCANPGLTTASDSNLSSASSDAARLESKNKSARSETSQLPVPPGLESSAVRRWASDDPHAFVSLPETIAQAELKLNAETTSADQPDVSDEMAANALKLYARGKLALLDNRTLSAIIDLQKAQKLDPRSVPILRELAHAYEMEQQPAKARDLYIKLLQLDPENVEVLFRVGISLEASNDWMRAVAYLGRFDHIADEQSVETGPRMMARWSLASSLAQLGYDTAYIQVMQKVLADAEGLADIQDLSPRLSALYRQRSSLWRALGDAQCRLGQFDDAQKSYQQASILPGAD
ncbi:MAG TPA: hypothetical protein VG711_03140, partial [Phycisphaerales bacterium]|nr:hypothetical protein [Phycisphaerales bacterium]